MKKNNYKTSVLLVLLILLALPAFSQRSRVKVYSTTDSPCSAKVSAYRTFIREKLYDDAYPTWLIAFNDNQCRDSSERIFVDGATIFRSFIESTPAGPLREARIDTLMLIYDLRIKHFGGEGNVLGRKGVDMLAYRGADITQVQQANAMLRKSIELQGLESRENVMRLLISSGVVLTKRGLLVEEQLIADYVLVIGNLMQLEEENSRWRRTRSAVEEMLLKNGILSCKTLDNYFDPLMDQGLDDPAFQKKVISSYRPLECDRSTLLVRATENLYRLEPGAKSAHSLARIFIAGNDLGKAEFYLKEALGENGVDAKTRSQWYYELALVKNAREDHCEAIAHAREAIALNSNSGQAYILLGDAMIASRKSLGNEFQKRTAYWAAADMYEKAASVDPSLRDEAAKKLTRSRVHFPDREDIFFSDIREGEAYRVEGCINDTTTVRARE
jgi:tetratricopeptide (TPR) repeat protein